MQVYWTLMLFPSCTFCSPPLSHFRKHILAAPSNPRCKQPLDNLYKAHPSHRLPNTPLHLCSQLWISSNFHLKFPTKCISTGNLAQPDPKLALTVSVQDLFKPRGKTGDHICPSIRRKVLLEDGVSRIRVILGYTDVGEIVEQRGV
jgi:hypothetical protein